MSISLSGFNYIYDDLDGGYLTNTTEGNCSVVAIKNIYNYFKTKCPLSYKEFYELGGCKSSKAGVGTPILLFVNNLVKKGYMNVIQPTVNIEIIPFILEELKKGHPVLISTNDHSFIIDDYYETFRPRRYKNKNIVIYDKSLEFSVINWNCHGIRKFVEDELNGYRSYSCLFSRITSDCLLRELADSEYKIKCYRVFSIIGVSPCSYEITNGSKPKKVYWHPASLELFYKKNYQKGWDSKIESIKNKKIELEKTIEPFLKEIDYVSNDILTLSAILNQGMFFIPIGEIEKIKTKIYEFEEKGNDILNQLEPLVEAHERLRKEFEETVNRAGRVICK